MILTTSKPTQARSSQMSIYTANESNQQLAAEKVIDLDMFFSQAFIFYSIDIYILGKLIQIMIKVLIMNLTFIFLF